MAHDRLCPRCGRPLPADARPGTCPACLLRAGLEPGSDAAPLDASNGDEVTLGFESTSPGRVLESLARSIGSIPRVLLPDTANDDRGVAVIKPSSDEMPPPSERGDRYVLFGEIARGGMGAVLKGRDPDLGRDLAVKVLLEGHRDKPDLLRRFVEEAQIGGQLQHPGIVPVYELGTFADSRPYFTMKLVKGRTLAAMLAERSDRSVVGGGSVPRPDRADRIGSGRGTEPPPTGIHRPTAGLGPVFDDLPRFLGIFEQVCQTVAYAHARGVIHRDLKPTNVMVGSFGEVQVMDWGLAKVLREGGIADEPPADEEPAPAVSVIQTVRSGSDADASQAGSALGTPAYMAPEQAGGDNEHVDRRADVFGLGSILCEVLTGRPVYTGRSQVEVLRKAMRGDTADALARLDSCEADGELIALARDCLAVEPDARPPDAQAVADRLREYTDSVHRRLRDAELAQAAESARVEEAKRTAAAESARAEAALAKARAERRARRLQAGLAASLIAMMALGVGGYAWNLRQREVRAARTTRAVDEALADATRLMAEAQAAPLGEAARWGEALAAARRAEALLAQEDADAPARERAAALIALIGRRRADAEERSRRLADDRALLAELESVRMDRASHGHLQRTVAAYAAAFRRAGLDVQSVGPDAAGRWIASRSEPAELAAYLDDWAAVSRRTIQTGQDDWRRLVASARAADPDPWRDGLRARLGAADPAARSELRRLAEDARTLVAQPPAGLILLARELADYGDGQADDRERAMRVLHLATSRHPGDFWAHFELARITLASGPVATRLEEAVRHLTAATAIRPGSASAHYHLGLALNLQRKQDDAIAEFRRALELKPDSSWAQLSLYETLEAIGQIEPEVAACREAVRLHPDDPWARASFAGALKAQRKLDEAIAEFREAIRLEPDMLLAHVELGGCLWNQGMRAEAALPWREAVRLDPDDPVMHVNLALALKARGEHDEAIAELLRATRLDPNKPGLRLILARTLEDRGQSDQAAAERREAVRLKTGRAATVNPFGVPRLGVSLSEPSSSVELPMLDD